MKNQANVNERRQGGGAAAADKTGLALSTSWNAYRYTNGTKLVTEITKIGFTAIELSFNLTVRIVKDIARLVDKGVITVTSLHNFCPIPDKIDRSLALPDFYSIASPDEDARKQALKYTKRTIDTAERLRAKAVVLHTGRVEIPDRTKVMIRLYQNGLANSEDYRFEREKAIREREEFSKPFFENALKSLDELNSYARKAGILLGVETRVYHREIPSFNEIGIILDKLSGGNIRYWHDTGHAQIMQDLGFYNHLDFLKAYSKEMLGIHLHDVAAGCRDHQAPPQGHIDFKALKPYVGDGVLKVLEAHRPASAEDIAGSKRFLEEVFEIKG